MVAKSKIKVHHSEECEFQRNTSTKIKCYDCGDMVERSQINNHHNSECPNSKRQQKFADDYDDDE